MPVQFSAVAVIEHQIKTLNELGMEEQEGKDSIKKIWDPNLTKCFVSTLDTHFCVSTLDTHFWCVFLLSFDQGCFGLEPDLSIHGTILE